MHILWDLMDQERIYGVGEAWDVLRMSSGYMVIPMEKRKKNN